ncbi:unnamed protein product [Polarella glacialis]|uniref:Uncharacterized protein n=1 Tax=Polarella glacialis TaxID=89957 RepID=A0A813F9N1_POLGL|nr:unnamed protein product [Polarella glacialis]
MELPPTIGVEEPAQEHVELQKHLEWELSERSTKPSAEPGQHSSSFVTLDQCKGKTRLGSEIYIVPDMAGSLRNISSEFDCSETSESPEESPGMPEIDSVLLFLDPFSVGYDNTNSILSCQLNYKIDEAADTGSTSMQPKMQDVVSMADPQKFDEWTEDSINSKVSGSEGLGSLQFSFFQGPGSRSSRDLQLLANDTEISVEWSYLLLL